MKSTSSTARGLLTGSTMFLIIGLTGCGGGGGDDRVQPVVQNPPPATDLVWSEGDWDEVNWQ